MELIIKIKKDKLRLFSLLIFICVTVLSVQQFYPSNQNRNKLQHDGKFKIFPFAVGDSGKTNIKAVFFAKDCYNSFLKLKEKSNILFASSASFSSSINEKNHVPVGFCAENGVILNKMPHQTMDGLVIIDNKKPSINAMKIIDLDKEYNNCQPSKCNSHFMHNNIRNNPSDTFSFINTIETHKFSSFQTQLVYTKFKSDLENFERLNNGTNDRSRRFLAICKKGEELYHVIVDSIEEDYLMASSKNALEHLRQLDYVVDFMINLDTGSKDIMYAHNGEYLKNFRPNPLTSSAKIENASSLLIYYTDI